MRVAFFTRIPSLRRETLRERQEPDMIISRQKRAPPQLDTLTKLRLLADDLTALGNNATAALVRKALDYFMAWM